MKKNLRNYHEANRAEVIFGTEALKGKRKHIEAVINLTQAIATVLHADVDRGLLTVLAEHHDDGRRNQYDLLGKFWDTEVSHNVLGVDRLERFIQTKEGMAVDEEIELLRQVMLYHGRLNLSYGLSEETKKYIEIVTAADDFENATSCVSYLVKEVETDAKGYCKTNPDADQKALSSRFVMECFFNGDKFDKVKYCHTYADYIIFAATLATSCIKKYGTIAKTALMQPAYGYASCLEGFKHTFEVTLNPELAERAYCVMSDMINNG